MSVLRLILVVCFLRIFFVSGQNQSLGSWNILNVKQNINQKSSLFFEAQLRSLLFYDHFHYHEFKAAYQYQFYPNFRVGIGGGRYDTYREGGDFVRPMNNSEIRIWPQIVFIDEVGKVTFEQRYRMEARFMDSGYRNRFRYRLGVLFSLTKDKKLQFTASNEVFFTDKEPYFERNRTQLAFQYAIDSHLQVQAGYLHQFDYRINDETGRDFLVIGLYFTLKSFSDKKGIEEIDLHDN